MGIRFQDTLGIAKPVMAEVLYFQKLYNSICMKLFTQYILLFYFLFRLIFFTLWGGRRTYHNLRHPRLF